MSNLNAFGFFAFTFGNKLHGNVSYQTTYVHNQYVLSCLRRSLCLCDAHETGECSVSCMAAYLDVLMIYTFSRSYVRVEERLNRVGVSRSLGVVLSIRSNAWINNK
jgi:hypothetical protein